ncbi:hypothetical protein BCR37DRAFT_127319 [Protomyces lactucae-debilis]|uniref:ABM domain-containing protein n=1 Tax=Protomyces lactucae-debilis TaxID=2754530 RepID=A0A1Y2FUJ7_PROLT|nr:uncharacterized protein BCR37DRAFT_127319 [Protomyces lactucae-debilis]ORY86866.1 hypothetical protein BCR37DRAFT_127319 [Protomyces lactucae-debilis]
MSIAIFPTLTAKPGQGDKVAAILPGLVKKVIAGEPKTLAYYFFRLTEKPDVFSGFELYEDKGGIKLHGATPHFAEFGKTAGPHFAAPAGLAFAAPAAGFLTRDTESASTISTNLSCIAVAVVISIKDEQGRIDILNRAKEACAKVQKNEPGTLSYQWFVDPKDAKKVFVFERYTDAAAVAAHRKNCADFLRWMNTVVEKVTIASGTPVGGFLKREPSLLDAGNTKL